MPASEAWIIDAARTPRGIGKPGKGALAGLHPQHILASVLTVIAERNSLHTDDIDDVVMGCNTQAGQQGLNIARMAALDAGYPLSAVGVTLDRFCGSALTAVNMAAMGVMSGVQHLLVAGGVESMSHNAGVPRSVLLDSGNRRLRKRIPQPHQGLCADIIATLEGFSREELDAIALQSQRRADVAIRADYFARSLVPVKREDRSIALDREEFPRPLTSAAGLSQLKPAFADVRLREIDSDGSTYGSMIEQRFPGLDIHHVHTAGTSSGVVDGASAVLLASPDYARRHGLKPRARIRAVVTVGDDPTLMLNGPVPATRRALAQAGMALSDIDLFEVNEAFAVVPLKFMRDLGVSPEIVNVNGGAIALGHPIGATGAMLLGCLLDELERRDLNVGLVTLCSAGGMAPATIIERL